MVVAVVSSKVLPLLTVESIFHVRSAQLIKNEGNIALEGGPTISAKALFILMMGTM